MRLLLDENVEYRIAAFLRGDGHDVTAVAHDYPQSLADAGVLRISHAEGRILITDDRDFGELVFRHGYPHSGIIYFSLPLDTTAYLKVEWLRRILSSDTEVVGRFVVVTSQGPRII